MAQVGTQSTQTEVQFPAVIPAAKVLELNKFTTTQNPLVKHFDLLAEKLALMAEYEALFNESERVPELESALKEAIDAQKDYDIVRTTAGNVFERHRHTAGETSTAIFEETEVGKTNYRDLTEKQRYARNAKFDEFKERVFVIQNPNDDYPGADFFFKPQSSRTAADEDEMEMTYGTRRNLRCPLTLLVLQEPMRSKLCPHVFSKDPIQQMIVQGGGICQCPISGCGKSLRMSDLQRDRAMERRIRDAEDLDESVEGEHLSDDENPDSAIDKNVLIL